MPGCLSAERIHISTPNKYEYQYVKKPARMSHFQVAVKTHNDAHFALSASPHDSAEMIEIVLGGRQNTRSWISVGKMGEPLVSAATPGILSWDEFRSFWISWRGGVAQVLETSAICRCTVSFSLTLPLTCLLLFLQVGHGLYPSNESVILQWAGSSGQFPSQVGSPYIANIPAAMYPQKLFIEVIPSHRCDTLVSPQAGAPLGSLKFGGRRIQMRTIMKLSLWGSLTI